MGKDLFDQYDVAKRLFAEADEALGYSIKDALCFEGPADDLKLTANTQPAILTVSVIVNEVLKEHGVQPDVAGGHSLGEPLGSRRSGRPLLSGCRRTRP